MIAYPRNAEEPNAEQNTIAPCWALLNFKFALTIHARAIKVSSSPNITRAGVSCSNGLNAARD